MDMAQMSLLMGSSTIYKFVSSSCQQIAVEFRPVEVRGLTDIMLFSINVENSSDSVVVTIADVLINQC